MCSLPLGSQDLQDALGRRNASHWVSAYISSIEHHRSINIPSSTPDPAAIQVAFSSPSHFSNSLHACQVSLKQSSPITQLQFCQFSNPVVIHPMFDALCRDGNSMHKLAIPTFWAGIAVPLVAANGADMYQGRIGPVPAYLDNMRNAARDDRHRRNSQGCSICPATPDIASDARP